MSYKIILTELGEATVSKIWPLSLFWRSVICRKSYNSVSLWFIGNITDIQLTYADFPYGGGDY